MSAGVSFQRKRTVRTAPVILTALAFVLASQAGPVLAQADLPSGASVFTIIVTRHGVRAPSSTPAQYDWADWREVGPDNLTGHGYRLMKLMGTFYRDAQLDKELPVDCLRKTAYVYADTATRTLATARALIEGLCGSPDALQVFHTSDAGLKDPIFDATSRLWQLHQADQSDSRAAVAAAAGSPYSAHVMQHARDFAAFQRLLGTRCSKGGCPPIASAASSIELGTLAEANEGKDILAELKGPIGIASTYAEDVFLEFAQCRPESLITSLDGEQLRADLAAGMRLHVLAYDVNARNAYNPMVRGATLLAHVIAMLDQKAGRTGVLGGVKIPKLDDQTLVIFSGHDTQLGALGGILNAHWNPEGGIVWDDMPPGAALIFDLVADGSGDYAVRLGFVAMALEQFRTEQPIEGAIKVTPVMYPGCSRRGCIMPLAQFESLALTLDAQGFVVDGWDASSSPLPLALLTDPNWTDPRCLGR